MRQRVVSFSPADLLTAAFSLLLVAAGLVRFGAVSDPLAIVLVEAARRSRRTFLGFLPFALGLLAATVYGRYHYLSDVLAGLALVPLCIPLARAGYARVAAWLAGADGTGRQTSR